MEMECSLIIRPAYLKPPVFFFQSLPHLFISRPWIFCHGECCDTAFPAHSPRNERRLIIHGFADRPGSPNVRRRVLSETWSTHGFVGRSLKPGLPKQILVRVCLAAPSWAKHMMHGTPTWAHACMAAFAAQFYI